MGQFTKIFLDGVVRSFDGRIYTISLPDGQVAIMKYSTVHNMCRFPESMLSDDHLSEGVTIRLCKIVKDDKVSILPDHRFYYAGNDNSPPENQLSENRELAEVVQETIISLTALLRIIKSRLL